MNLISLIVECGTCGIQVRVGVKDTRVPLIDVNALSQNEGVTGHFAESTPLACSSPF